MLSRDPASGEFAYLEAEVDGTDDPADAGGVVEGIGPTRGLAISADGETVYVASYQGDNSIAVFDRDPASGRLSFLERERDGVDDPSDPGGSVDGLFRPVAVAVSADGKSVYAVTQSDDTLVVFTRDPASGRISYVEHEEHGVNDPGDAGGVVTGLQSGTDVAVSPDGEAVYVTADSSHSIAVFERDAASSEISFVEAELDNVNDPGDPGGTVEGLFFPSSIAIAPGGEYLYAAASFDSAIAMFERDATTQELSFAEAERNGVDDPGDAGTTVTGLSFPRSIALSSGGANLYAVGGNESSIASFRVAGGELVFVESETEGVDPGGGDAIPTGMRGPSAVAVPADGGHVYVAGDGESGLAVFARTPAASPTFGALSFVLAFPELSLPTPRGATITPDGMQMVVTTLGDQSVRSFARNPATGTIALLDTETQEVDDPSDPGPEAEGLEEPKAVAIAANGTDVYVTDTSGYAVSLFKLAPASGELTYVETEFDGEDDPGDAGGEVDGLYEPWDVVITPDGTGVYVPGNSEDAVAAFDRDPATGALSFVDVAKEGVGGVEGIEGVDALAISPDGLSLYAVGGGNGEAAVFARDPATNKLTQLEVEREGFDDPGDPGGPVEGNYGGPHDVVVSRDGGQVYFGANAAFTRFERDPASGRISFAEVAQDGVGGLTGVGGVRRLELSFDGTELYAATNPIGGALFTFSLAPGSGALGLLDAVRTNEASAGGPVSGLDGAQDLLIAPDDRLLYVVSEDENGLAVFNREQPASPQTPAPIAAPIAAPAPVADTTLLGPSFKAAKKQRQKGKQVVVALILRAGERARGSASGRILVGKRSYRLKPLTASLAAGKVKKLRLKPAKAKHRQTILAALKRGEKVVAKLTARIADPAGNSRSKALSVRLTYKLPKS